MTEKLVLKGKENGWEDPGDNPPDTLHKAAVRSKQTS